MASSLILLSPIQSCLISQIVLCFIHCPWLSCQMTILLVMKKSVNPKDCINFTMNVYSSDNSMQKCVIQFTNTPFFETSEFPAKQKFWFPTSFNIWIHENKTYTQMHNVQTRTLPLLLDSCNFLTKHVRYMEKKIKIYFHFCFHMWILCFPPVCALLILTAAIKAFWTSSIAIKNKSKNKKYWKVN